MALRLLRNSYLLSKLENLYIKGYRHETFLFFILLLFLSLFKHFSQTQMIINRTSTTDSIWLSDIKSITFKTYPTSASVSIVKRQRTNTRLLFLNHHLAFMTP